MKCPSCQRVYNEKEYLPLNLPCGHTFCKQCLKISFKGEESIECRECFKPCKRRIKDLTRNFIALSAGCEAREMSKKFRGCLKHSGEYLRYYCEDCEVAFCPCCVVDHPGHSFAEQKFSVESLTRRLSVLREQLADGTRQLEVSRTRLDEQLKTAEQKSAEELQNFGEKVRRLTEFARTACDRVASELRGRCQGEESRLKGLLERVGRFEGDLTRFLKDVEGLEIAMGTGGQEGRVRACVERLGKSRSRMISEKQVENFSFVSSFHRLYVRRIMGSAAYLSMSIITSTRRSINVFFYGRLCSGLSSGQ